MSAEEAKRVTKAKEKQTKIEEAAMRQEPNRVAKVEHQWKVNMIL